MSRRRSRIQPLPWEDLPQAQWEQVAWWWDEIPGHPGYTWHDWQDAWADLTLSVVWNVWRKQGSRIYAVHRDQPLREDLQDWLLVQAQEAAGRFIPAPSHPAPSRQWMAYLYNTLTPKARYHFDKAVGRYDGAREAWNAGIASVDHLNDMEAETGYVVNRHALHGQAFGTEDPAAVVIRLEDLSRQIDNLEREQLRSGTYTTASSSTGTCIVNLCTRPVRSRGLCEAHYLADRRLQGNLDRPCNVPDCTGTHKGRGLCDRHLQRWRAGTLPAELEQYVEAQGRKPGVKPDLIGCREDGCGQPIKARGKCIKHYTRWIRQNRPPEETPCSEPDCDKPRYVRGLCTMHYQRARAAEKKGTPLEQEGPPSQEEPPTEATT